MLGASQLSLFIVPSRSHQPAIEGCVLIEVLRGDFYHPIPEVLLRVWVFVGFLLEAQLLTVRCVCERERTCVHACVEGADLNGAHIVERLPVGDRCKS
jgi:hypothetical protein